jgi:hypothetical protein
VSPSPATRKAVTGEAEQVAENAIATRFAGSEVVPEEAPEYSSEELIAITTWEDIAHVIDSHGIEVQFADQVLGDGFSVLSTDEKMTLIGRPMMLLEWRFNDGQQGEFVSCRAVVKTGDLPQDIKKIIINDGSTGIRDQLKKFTGMTGKRSGLLIRRGLRVSEYTYEDDKTGEKRPAKTFYIDTSA